MSRPRIPAPDVPVLTASFLASLVLLLPLTALANDAENALGLLAPSGATLALRALGSLGGVVALIVLLALFLRRLRDSTRGTSGETSLRAVGRLDLGGRREIRVVEVGAHTLVLGVTERRIDLLTELEGAAVVSRDASVAEPVADEPRPAFRLLRKLATSG